ncbi:toll/interleukin-1 receptor domain-containing protein [Bacillaceae bacterium W0354]
MKFFISHSSKDSDYGDAIVQLLVEIGVPQENIIFTSKAGYGIPKGKDIYQWIKSEMKDRPFVIYLLSENYYDSIACLNEMGAAWVIENEHIALIVPGFSPSDPKFFESAIEPREMGVFIDKKEEIIDFVDVILNKLGKSVNNIIRDSAISNYMKNIDKRHLYTGSEHLETEEGHLQQVQSENLEKIPTIRGNKQEEAAKSTNKEEKISFITSEKFQQDIQNDKLTDQEMLLLKYMIDMAKNILGDRWMAEGEINNIKRWEEVNGLDDHLSRNYNDALRRFIIRKYVDVYSTTSHGNPREYILIDEISNQFLDLPDGIMNKIDETVNSHQLSKDYNVKDLPF